MTDLFGPLTDLVVVDLSRVLAGPFAAMMLADLGATVIKVERPDGGDDTRAWGPPFVGPEGARESTYFLSVNRNKKSVVLDFKKPEDLATLMRLIGHADVLIENFRPGVMERLGLEHQRLLELNPRLVLLSITGFGHDGPEADRVAYDQILQGEAGLMSLTGPGPDEPTKFGIPISDILSGVFGAYGALAALHERERTGRGRIVRSSLLAASVAIHAYFGARWLIAGDLPQAAGNGHATIAPYGTFRCADGFVQIAVGNDAIWRRLAPLIGMDPADPRYATNADRVRRRVELNAAIDERLVREPGAEWLARFLRHDIPAGEIRTLDKVYESAQVASQGLIVESVHPTVGRIRLPGPPLRFDGMPPVEHAAAPTLGQHTDEIIAWLDALERRTAPLEPAPGLRS